MSAPETKLRLTVGGAVNPRTSVYIIRPSDDELLELLERGEYCNVLCSRQMGKTSLLKRTRARLVERGYATAEIEVAGLLGSPKDADEWYQGLLDEIARQLRLPVSVPDWWRATSAVTANQKLIRFFREEVIAKIPGDKPVIIFLDEIDSTLKLPYTDDFFVAIRAMYNDRASDPVNEGIAFCLVGVATPNELIKERRTTPYNIGRTIELQDFDADRDDLGPIYRSLCEDEALGEATAREVIRETGGHPYLTLRVCDALAARPCASPTDVAAVVGQTFGSLDSLKSDVHFDQMLRFINERVDDKLSTLDLYRRVIGDKAAPDQTTPAHVNLKLIGLAKRDGRGNLAPRNPVYRRLFNDAWARSAMPPVERRVRTARRLAVAALVLAMLSPVFWFEIIYPQERINTLNQVLDDYHLAQNTYRELRRVPFYSGKADDLLAAFYERRAFRDEQTGKRDEALLWRLNALAIRPTDERGRLANELIAPDYMALEMTFRHPIQAFSLPPLLDAELEAEAIRKVFETLNIELVRLISHSHTWTRNVSAFSPDGQKIIIGSTDNTAQLWSIESGQPIGQPMRHESLVQAVVFSPDGSKVLTGSRDQTARLWSAQDGKTIGDAMRHGWSVNAVAFSPDGSKVLTGSEDQTARLWSAVDGKPIGDAMRHASLVQAVAFSPDGSKVLTGSEDQTARLWSAVDGKPIGDAMRHRWSVNAVAFSPDGSKVLTGSFDQTARLWSAVDGKPIGDPMRHANWVGAVAFSPDGSKVLTGSFDQTARLWSAVDGKPIGDPMRHANWVGAVAFSPDGSKVLTGSFDQTARLWSAVDGKPIGDPMRHRWSVNAVAFSPDGSKVLTGSFDQTARLWSAVDGKPIGDPMRHANWVGAVAFSPDGSKVLTGSFDQTARLWSAVDGKPIGDPMRHANWVGAVAFSPDGSKVLTGSFDQTARLWSAVDGKPIGDPMRHGSRVRAVAFSPDGSKVLTGSFDQTARLWSAVDGKPIGDPMRHASLVRAVAFSPDGSKVLTGSSDQTARLWSAVDGKPIGDPMQHESSVQAVAFSPNGSKVLTGSYDKTARLWSAQDGKPIGETMRYSDDVRAVAFSPDGQLALAATARWLHAARVESGAGLRPVISRLLPGAWIDGSPDALRFLDPSGRELQIAVLPSGDTVRVVRLRLDRAEAEPIAGDPKRLLDEWQRRLGLKINEAGEIVPRW